MVWSHRARLIGIMTAALIALTALSFAFLLPVRRVCPVGSHPIATSEAGREETACRTDQSGSFSGGVRLPFKGRTDRQLPLRMAFALFGLAAVGLVLLSIRAGAAKTRSTKR